MILWEEKKINETIYKQKLKKEMERGKLYLVERGRYNYKLGRLSLW